MILGLSSADSGMTVGLYKLSSLDGRRPPWCRHQVHHGQRGLPQTHFPPLIVSLYQAISTFSAPVHSFHKFVNQPLEPRQTHAPNYLPFSDLPLPLQKVTVIPSSVLLFVIFSRSFLYNYRDDSQSKAFFFNHETWPFKTYGVAMADARYMVSLRQTWEL